MADRYRFDDHRNELVRLGCEAFPSDKIVVGEVVPVGDYAARVVDAVLGNADTALLALGMRLCGYLCPECHTWAEDMTPNCHMSHENDPVATIPFYLDDRKA